MLRSLCKEGGGRGHGFCTEGRGLGQDWCRVAEAQ